MAKSDKNHPSHGDGGKHDHDHASFVETSIELLKKSGARITQPRLAVLECLAKAGHALGPKDLLAQIEGNKGGRGSRKKSSIDLATIYRILEAFAELGIVHRVGSEGGFMACAHLDCEAAMHVVTHCLSCEKTREVDLPPDLQNAVGVYIKSATRFRPTEHFLQMNGICSECASRAKAKGGE